MELEGAELKLCYNQTDNAYMVAEKFVVQNNLGVHMMEQVCYCISMYSALVETGLFSINTERT